MSKFENLSTHVVVSVDDSKDDRFADGWKVFGTASPAPKSDTPDKSWKVADLKAFADEKGIDLGEATKKDDILTAISAGPQVVEDASNEDESDSEDSSDDDSE